MTAVSYDMVGIPLTQTEFERLEMITSLIYGVRDGRRLDAVAAVILEIGIIGTLAELQRDRDGVAPRLRSMVDVRTLYGLAKGIGHG